MTVAGLVALTLGCDGGRHDQTDAPSEPEIAADTRSGTTSQPTLPPRPMTPTTSRSPTSTGAAAVATFEQEGSDPQAVLDAVVRSWRAFNEAKLDPTNDGHTAALSEVTGGDLLASSIEVVARYRAENQRSITHPHVPATIVPYQDTLIIDTATSTAQVDYCRVGSNILVEVGGEPDGSDRVIDDSVNTYIERARLSFQNGRWIETGEIELERLEDASACPTSESVGVGD
jgi:hypothetical protein